MALEQEISSVVNSFMNKCINELTTCLHNNDFSAYYYQETRDYYDPEKPDTYSVSDTNYLNRARIAYALMFKTRYQTDPILEPIIRRLFIEEIIDRETNSFQGMGDTVTLLASLLSEYKKDDDQQLFERVKAANFDCGCAFDLISKIWLQSVENNDIDWWIYTTMDLEEREYCIQLIELWKKQQTLLGTSKQTNNLRFADYLGDFELILEASKQSFKLSENENTWDYCSQGSSYLELLIEHEKYSSAFEVLQNILPKVENASTYGFGVGLAKHIIEYALDLMTKDEENQQAIWEFSYPYLKKAEKHMTINIYKKAINIGILMEDDAFVTHLKALLNYERKRVGL
ncbi:MAG: hypothetical protein ACRCXK_12400 [Wohlfahrtiimonas sp.]